MYKNLGIIELFCEKLSLILLYIRNARDKYFQKISFLFS